MRLEKIADTPKGTENEWLVGLAANYRLLKGDEVLPEGDALSALVAELMMRVDAVPPSLALGVAAYDWPLESPRFKTSRCLGPAGVRIDSMSWC